MNKDKMADTYLVDPADLEDLLEVGHLCSYVNLRWGDCQFSPLDPEFRNEHFKKEFENIGILDKIKKYVPVMEKYGFKEKIDGLKGQYNAMMRFIGQPELETKAVGEEK